MQSLQLALGVGFAQKINFFFWKVQRGLDQEAQAHQRVAQLVHFTREVARQRAHRAACGRLRAGVDQVGNRLGLHQVDFVVQKRAFAKFARLRQPQPGQAGLAVGALGLRHFQAARQQQLQHHRPAVRLQFEHVFAGERMRCGEIQRQPLVQMLALGVGKRQVMRLAWR
jgi:hypothetical protein